ncbi:MAG TPA: TIM barrel protein [Candidatus Acidoferrales bacterium]|nr:TIM barrel protein [Candidatus Acidoferrales bacterium]
MSRIALGLCSVTFRALAPEQTLELAAQAQVEGIEWGADVHVPVGDLVAAQRVAAATSHYGIAVASYGSYVEAGAVPVSAFSPVLETAVALGAPNIRIWAGRRGVASVDVPPDERARCIADLRTMAEQASQAGVTLSLEFHRLTLTDSLASTLDILRHVNHEALYTYWQPRPGIGALEAIEELIAVRPWLSHLHVFNWNEQRERFPLAPAEPFWHGVLETVSAAPDPRFDRRWAMIEFVRGDDPAVFPADAEALRRWLASLPHARAAVS